MKANNTQLNISNIEKFQNAEQLWFWFVYSKSVQKNFIYQKTHTTKRPCELLDVETLITKLYLSGQLSDEQLETMKLFGDKRRAPHQYIWTENKATSLWKSAMTTLYKAAKEKDWIE